MSTFFDKGPQPLLWAGLMAAPFKVTLSSTGDGKGKGHPRTGHEGSKGE